MNSKWIIGGVAAVAVVGIGYWALTTKPVNTTPTTTTTTVQDAITITATLSPNGPIATINGSIVSSTGLSCSVSTISWGDGTATNGPVQLPQAHTYTASGTYAITINAKDSAGTTATTSTSVTMQLVSTSTTPPPSGQAATTQTNPTGAYMVVFVPPGTVATYSNFTNYARVLVVGNNAYTSGNTTDNWVKNNGIGLTSVSAYGTGTNGENSWAGSNNIFIWTVAGGGDAALGILGV